MPESTPTPLTDQAMARLRKLADGNGLAPDQIELKETDEKIYTLEGTLNLVPKCERHSSRYAGPVRGKDRQILSSVSAMHTEAQRRQEQFQNGSDWVEASVKELKAAPGQGWGLQGAQITLPEKSAILAAAEACPACQGRRLLTCGQCQGQGSVTCSQCQGGGHEACPTCGGGGSNPLQPGQPCIMCHGTRQTVCRFCRGSGQLACPTCGGQRGTPCGTCQGTGKITEEIALACSTETQFKLGSEGLPSGLRRGLDRLGVANLAKGHADIELITPKADPKDSVEFIQAEGSNGGKVGAREPVLHYRAKLPYADLKIRFGGERVVLVSAFGKRGALLGTPPFLDNALQPWRTKLRQAAAGVGALDAALEARVIREALALSLEGKGNVTELRRNYVVGLSPEAAREILANIRQSVGLATQRTRSLIAAGCGIASAVFFGIVFFTSLHARIIQDWTWTDGLVLDVALPIVTMAVVESALNFLTRFALRRHFPGHKIALRPHTGKIVYVMLAVIFVAYIAIVAMAPTKPPWILHLFP